MQIMIRRDTEGGLRVYVPKKDLEEPVAAVRWADEGWGGTFLLENGLCLEVSPLTDEPRLPITLNARRVGS